MSLAPHGAGPESFVLPRLVISSISGGGGKTMLSLGLCRALRERGRAVLPLKKGPDYIDAAWLSAAAGCPASNLDPYLLDGCGLRAQLGHARRTLINADRLDSCVAIIEGNRGLFDGLDVSGSCSTSHLARELAAPVLLTINVTKMTRTCAALLQGLAGFEKGLRFAGVVLNRTGSSRHATYLRQSIEAYTDFAVLGELPRLRVNLLPERHMGIASFRGEELSDEAESVFARLASFVRDNVDIDSVLDKAAWAPPLTARPFWPAQRREAGRCRIGYVRDQCLWFYYRENLEALERQGAELIRLSLFDQEPWPFQGEKALDAVYLGGGFPEDYLDALRANPRLAQLAEQCRAGLPVYAECGGLMVLARSIVNQEERWPMAGVLPVDIAFGKKPRGLGYVRGRTITDTPFYPAGLDVRGHEFHYSHALDGSMDKAAAVLRLERGLGLNNGCDALVSGRTWGSYTHIFAPVLPAWAENFVNLACARREERRSASLLTK